MTDSSMKLLMFIDGDNLNESNTERIFEEAKKLGEVLEAHCFGDFLKRKESWEDAYNKYGVQLHYIPGKSKRKGKPDPNTSDIALTVLAMKKLYANTDIDGVIIVANDKDYVPLAKEIREGFHKKAYMFYNEQDDGAVVSYDGAVLLSSAQSKEKAAKQSKALKIKENASLVVVNKKAESEQQTVKECIEKGMNDEGEALLANLGTILQHSGISYPAGGLGDYLTGMFAKFPKVFNEYELILSDKRDRVVRKQI